MPEAYSRSHLADGKGEAYDRSFAGSDFLRYLWGREQTLLASLAERERTRADGSLDYLDFACGTGRILSVMEGRVDRSVGVDISPTMIGEASSKVTTSELVLGDAISDPSLVTGTFRLATAFRFFPNAEPALREAAAEFLAGKVESGGLLIVNNHQNASSALCVAGRLVGKKWGWTPMRNREMRDVLGRHGFRPEGARGFGMLPGTDRSPYAPLFLHRVADSISATGRLDRFGQDVVMWFRRT